MVLEVVTPDRASSAAMTVEDVLAALSRELHQAPDDIVEEVADEEAIGYLFSAVHTLVR